MSCELFFSPLVSLVPVYTGFLIYQEAGAYLLWRIKTPCCLQNPVISPQFYCLQFGNCPPVLLPEEQMARQSKTHSTPFSGYCQRICCANDCLQCRCPDADPPLCIMGWQDRVPQEFLVLLPKRKMLCMILPLTLHWPAGERQRRKTQFVEGRVEQPGLTL